MKIVNIYPNTHRVWVAEKIFEEKTKGGVIIPDDLVRQYQNMSCEGRIVAMAENAFAGDDFIGMTDSKPKIGDIVYFKKYDGLGYTYNKKPYRVIIDSLIEHWSTDFIEPEDDIC